MVSCALMEIVSAADMCRHNGDCGSMEDSSNFSRPSAASNETPDKPKVENMRVTLTFIVPVVSLLATVPAFIAWIYRESAPGSTHDSNFWQAISSSIMQLLSLVTFMWPRLSNPRLSQLTWFWIWLLAGFSATCAIVSVPVYLVYPTIWSFVVAFAGVLAQAVVLLQFVSAV